MSFYDRLDKVFVLPEGIIVLFWIGDRPFYFNKKFVFSWHEWIHFFGALLPVPILHYYFGVPIWTAFWMSWGFWILLDIVDGFKKLYTEGRDKSWLVQNLLYADGFSWSDVFVFDLIGALVGALIGVYL